MEVAFFGILAGAVLSVAVYLLWLYFFYQPRLANPELKVQPEDRLRPGQVGAICIPICLFIFAWTSRARYVIHRPGGTFPDEPTNQLQCTLDCAYIRNCLFCSGLLSHVSVNPQLPWRVLSQARCERLRWQHILSEFVRRGTTACSTPNARLSGHWVVIQHTRVHLYCLGPSSIHPRAGKLFKIPQPSGRMSFNIAFSMERDYDRGANMQTS